METQLAHCAYCDKEVHVARTPVAPHPTHANIPDGGKLICMEVGEDCEGVTCPLSGMPTLVMGVRLARSGGDRVWPHVHLTCTGCGRGAEMEVLDGTHAFCPLCKSTNSVALVKLDDGHYEAVNPA